MDRGAVVVGLALVVAASCATSEAREGAAAGERAAELRRRFVHAGAASFASAARVSRPANVRLPLRSSGAVTVEDVASRVAVAFSLRGGRDVARVTTGDGLAVYPAALDGADVIHRVYAEGTEDFVAFDGRPAREELAYDVDVSHAAGLRLVARTLELLDAGGTPRLRVAPPRVYDAAGTPLEAEIAVDGCAYDADPAAPWGRAVTAPGAATCVVRILWSCDAYPALVDPAWTTTGSLATARFSHSATLLASGSVLVAGGLDASTQALSSAELFDGVGSFAATSAMTARRVGHGVTRLPSGAVLVAGGTTLRSLDSSGYLSSAELYDATGHFVATGSMTVARFRPTATLLRSGKVLLAGGFGQVVFDGGLTGGMPLSTAELFDGTSQFAATGSMKDARESHTATLLASGKVLVAGGEGGGAVLPRAEVFDGTSTFTPTAPMTTAREAHAAALLASGKVLLIGGIDGGNVRLSTAELYDEAGTFTATGSMQTGRDSVRATPVPSGRVLVTGGHDAFTGSVFSTAELYDGATFAATASMQTARFLHSATLLASNAVLVAGGYDGTGTPMASAELLTLCGPSDPPCTAPCTADRDCAAGEYCKAGTCVPKAATGTCGEAGECASGFCVDGFCCDGACTGTCEACDVAGAQGKCTAVAGAPHGARGACPSGGASDPCAARACDGVDRSACQAFAGPSTPCRAAACDGHDVVPPATCDGHGHCPAPAATSCGSYGCSAGQCLAACASDADCAPPNVCDATKRCAPPSPPAGGGGCAVSFARAPSPALLLLVAAVGIRCRRGRRAGAGRSASPSSRRTAGGTPRPSRSASSA